MAHEQGCHRHSAQRMPKSRHLRSALFLFFTLVSALTAGCMSQTSYQPNPQRLADLGLSQTQKQLEEVLLRSINPSINAVEVADSFVRVDLTNTTYQIRVFFKDVQKAEVFTNNLVALRSSDNRILFRPIFADEQDAKTFADLMLAMGSR